MKHRFYHKKKQEQNRIQFIIGLSSLLINLCILALSIVSECYIIVILSVPVTLSVIAPFFDTPALKKSGKLRYYSSLFLAEKEKNGIVTIHGGTLFDYFFVIDKNWNGRQRTNFIIKSYLEGILNLIEAYEFKNTDSIKIKGTTYIINERTARKIGFEVVKTNLVQKIILIYNYVNLVIANSIAKAKLSFPNLKDIRTFEADLNRLIRKKEFIVKMNSRLRYAIEHNENTFSPRS